MESEVIAALIGAPAVLATAATAYAAGRAQAHSARRGPVDAIRRQHQREAYAHLVAETRAYTRKTTRALVLQDVIREDPERARQLGPEGVVSLTHDRCAAVDDGPLHAAAALVSIEGPDRIAMLADSVVLGTVELKIKLVSDWIEGTRGSEWLQGDIDALGGLERRLREFIEASRAQLNGLSSD